MQIFKTHKIAVFLSSSGDISNFFECDHFSVFRKSGSDWNIERTEKFKIACFDSVKMLRNELSSVISCISDCNVVAGGELTGVAFSAFDMAGFHIFNINDISDETLSGILEDIEKGNSEEKYKQEIIKNACPIETETPGIYRITSYNVCYTKLLRHILTSPSIECCFFFYQLPKYK